MNRKLKWRNLSITQENVGEYLQDLYDETKGQYITQGVSFNKDDPYQMGLLRLALLEPQSFSGFCKHLLAKHFKSEGKTIKEMSLSRKH
ncbi:hypothetical protein ACK8P5_00445 [Paenibacillus sp. EC2-1]|uniref:hypothetical protein n=1 Tax=Paenibacillus sp. EC2-1 TaxID=3388665 RepID=UPI003BEEE569